MPSRGRLIFAVLAGAVFGLGASVANMQAGSLGVETFKVVSIIVVTIAISVGATFIARFRIARYAIWIGSFALIAGSILLAEASALQPASTNCGVFDLNGETINPGSPGGLGSRSNPRDITLSDATELTLVGETDNWYTVVAIGYQLVEPASSGQFGLDPSSSALTGQAFDVAVIVNDDNGLKLSSPGERDGGQYEPVPGLIRVSVRFDGGGANNQASCAVDVYLRLIARPSSTLIGKVAIGLTILGGLAMAVNALALRPSPTQPTSSQTAASEPATSQPPQEASASGAAPSVGGDWAAAAAPPPKPAEDNEATERFVHTQVEVKYRPVSGFVGGQSNLIVTWIGPHNAGPDIQVTADPIRREFVPTDTGLDLEVTLKWDGGESTKSMKLPGATNEKSNEVGFNVELEPGQEFAGDLIFRAQPSNKVFEYVRIIGTAGDMKPGEAPELITVFRNHELLDVTQSTQVESTWVARDDELLRFGPRGVETYSTDGLDQVAVEVAASIASIQAGEIVDWKQLEPHVREMLYMMAVSGSNLYDELHLQRRQAASDDLPDGPLQILTTDPKQPVPLEFVYDRGATSKDFTINLDCIAALGDPTRDRCNCRPAPELTDDERFSNPELCPYGFWGLSRVIERHALDPNGFNDIAHPDGIKTLPALSSVLMGMSERFIDTAKPEPIIDLRGEMATIITTDVVDGWSQWRAAVRSTSPPLRVALPHHEKASNSLEMGGETLGLNQVLALAPGQTSQVLVLLGCETDVAGDDGLMSFAVKFQQGGTPIVVGTMAKLVAQDALAIAVELVTQLQRAAATGGRFGEALLRTRQLMFARGFPVALAVSALGDADWTFAEQAEAPAAPELVNA